MGTKAAEQLRGVVVYSRAGRRREGGGENTDMLSVGEHEGVRGRE